ncbi:YbjN domain-containing protein [Alphaproteobacteria bacterium]|nr:YbjN domain-containing protein [Alphaproteobacteria bacterium]
MDQENFVLNPIDIVEEVIHGKKWSFSRSADCELVAEITSRLCQYRLYFTWSEQIRAISFTVTFDIKFPQSQYRAAHELLALINEKLWIGHFDITKKNGIPAYRHTVLSLPENEMLQHQLEDLVDIAIYECEKYYPAFQLVLYEDSLPSNALSVSTFNTIGNA